MVHILLTFYIEYSSVSYSFHGAFFNRKLIHPFRAGENSLSLYRLMLPSFIYKRKSPFSELVFLTNCRSFIIYQFKVI